MLPPLPQLATFRTDLAARAAYAEGAGIYRIVPAGVARPGDVAELVALLRWAGAHGVPLVPRGAGSAMGGSSVGDGVVLDLAAFAADPVVDAATCRVGAGAAVTLATLDAAARPHGLRLPPDPSSARWATAGGAVGTNAAGARTVRDGPVRAWVDALELVTPDGEIHRLTRGGGVPARFAPLAAALAAARDLIAARFPRTRKNTAGYALDAFLTSGDLLDLVIGAEGTLGVVTAVTWRLAPVPAARAGLRVALDGLGALGAVVEALLAEGPSAVELLDRSFLEVADGAATAGAAETAGTAGFDARAREGAETAVLLVEFEAETDDEVASRARRAASAVERLGARAALAIDAAAQAALWALRHAASPRLAQLPETTRSLQVIEDGCVPVPHLGAYVEAVHAASARHGVRAVCFGHAGDGHLHVNLLPDVTAPGFEARLSAVLDDVTEAVLRLGGTVAGEHGAGRLRAPLLARMYGEEIMALFRRVKQAFDPAGILNPGVILPDGTPPVSRLKVGTGAAALPEAIARGLRAIERTGGYAIDRLALADGRVVP